MTSLITYLIIIGIIVFVIDLLQKDDLQYRQMWHNVRRFFRGWWK